MNECFECDGKVVERVQPNFTLYLRGGLTIAVEYKSSFCDKCGQEVLDAAQSDYIDDQIEKALPNYFRK